MNENISKANFSLSGLTCASCTRSVENTLKKLQGITPTSITVNLLMSNAIFEFDENVISAEKIKQAIIDAGFGVEDIKIEKKKGLPSKSQKAITKDVKHKSIGIDDVLFQQESQNPARETAKKLVITATLEFDGNITSAEKIQAIIDAGFEVEDIKIEKDVLPSKPQKAITKDDKRSSIEIDVSSQQENQNPARETITKLIVTGMTCASCISTVQYSLESTSGVEYAHVNLLTGEANIKHDMNKVGPRDLIKVVEDSGFGAELFKKDRSDKNGNSIRIRAEKHQKLLRKRFFISLSFSIPVALISMVFMMFLPHSNPVNMAISYQIIPGLEIGTLILFILATPVQFILGYPFYMKGIRSVWYSRQANMDTLVAIGTTVAYFGSILNVMIPIISKDHEPGYQFFETSVFLITFIWLGRWMEAKVKGKTFETITKLMELQPEKATLINIDHDEFNQEIVTEKEIDLELVQVDDILKVNPGAKVPCDGKIYRGTTSLDESMLTGESIPVTKKVNDDVITATVNLSSMIWIKATRVGSDTTLSRIIELVQAAQSSKKAPIEVLADKIAQVFVPAVISISITVFVIWVSIGAAGKIPGDWLRNNQSYQIFSLFFAISVMVIACPCAMGLASPTAIMVGTGLAARYGILIKGGGEAIEMTSRLDIIAFDKTGTLTYGKPKVVGKKVYGKRSDKEGMQMILFQIIGIVESSSDHPLAKAIVKHVNKHYSKDSQNVNVTSESVTETPGKGLRAVVKVNNDHESRLRNSLILDYDFNDDYDDDNDFINNTTNSTYYVYIGNEKWLQENGCVYPTDDQKNTTETIKEWKNSGCSVVLVGLSTEPYGGNILAQIGIADTPRRDAAKTVSELTARGIEVWMITGDNPITAKAIAYELGIENVLAEVTPEMKAEKIKWLQRRGRPVKKSNKILGLFQSFKNKFNRNSKMNFQLTRRAIVAMIGDGINDSPALAQSDLPISIASASDVAIESASVILTRSTLGSLITLVELSKAIIWRIRYNFLWAYIYNSLAVPIAAGVFFPLFKVGLRPEIAGLAMAVSSISVVLSSLWLKRFKEPKF